jgi:hypothetical protein
MPPREAFESPEAFAQTGCHELGHNAAVRIMPHGCCSWLVLLALAMRHIGIIRAFRDRQAVGHPAGIGRIGFLA